MSDSHAAVGAYVVHALGPEERAEFEAHLAECETCRREVAEFRETTGELSVLSSAAPPPELKGSVMRAIAGVRVLPPEPEAAPAAGAGSTLPAPSGTAAAGDELALHRARRANRVLTLAVAAVTVVALVLGGWAISLSQRQPPVAAASAETQLLQAPDLRSYTVALKGGGTATFLVSRGLNRALLSGSDLPEPGAGRTYQLWTLAGPLSAPTRVTPDALVTGGGSAKQWFTGPVATSDAVAISIEPAGGATAPSDILGVTGL